MAEQTGLKTEQKMLLGSLAAGLIAAALVFFLVHDIRVRMEKMIDPVEVVAAAKYVPAFAELDEDSLTTIKLPGSLLTGAHMKDMKKALGKRAVVPFVQGEPIMANKIADKGGEINTVISTGMRALSVSSNKENSVSYMIKPGDYVDVLLTYETTGQDSTSSSTVTLLQSVQVIAVGGNISMKAAPGADGYETVTLSLTPLDAEILTFGLEKGRINLSLRPAGDTQIVGVRPASFEDMKVRSMQNNLQKQNININTQQPAVTPAAGDDATRRVIE
jgi:pilus assembly protein CpaB